MNLQQFLLTCFFGSIVYGVGFWRGINQGYRVARDQQAFEADVIRNVSKRGGP